MVDKKNENTHSKVEQNIGQNLKAEGNISLSNITQIGQQVVQQKLDFFELDIEKYQPSPEFIKLEITSDLIDSINDNRLLVLGESPNVDLAIFARYLASYWSNQQLASTTQKLVVKEWYRNSDPQTIDVELQNTKESTVFILTQVSPQNIVGYSLQQIQQVAFSSSHYVIVTTDIPLVAWKLPERAKTFWRELTVEDVANSQELVNKLTDKESIHDWYYHRLTPREQLLALGLSFFDGLFDDQFFAALEEVVENAWQRRDTTLSALDYCDLDNLRSFFNFTETNTSITFIEVRFPKQRQMLLKVAWKSHRRQILAALPVLVNLVKNSVRRYERELYGSSLRCDQLRRVISETISDIGLIASDAVEESLLNIAADEDINVQAVAAQAMALWRDDNKREFIVDEITNHHIDRQLFETLQHWQKEARVSSLINAILNERNHKDSKQPVDYIRSTIALTVGYAALYDPPDQLSPELLELLKHLITEQNELVRNRVFAFTLPRLISRHIIQLRDILHDMLRYIDDSVLAVANSLAFAYRFRPNDVLETLTLWNSECKKTRLDRTNIAEVTSREALLATVALTYGKIECDQSIGTLTPLVAVQHLKIILLEELHPRVREIALFAIGCQANRAFDQVEPELQDLVSGQITQKERQEVAEILTEIYLKQRFQLRGGEQTIEIDNKKYRVWLNSTRPLTTIEQAMVHWVKNKQNPMAQQVATNAIANFVSRLEQEEERQIKQLREGRDSLETTSITVYAAPIEGGKAPQDWYYGKLIPWLATRNAENYRTAIRNLLPEGLRQYKISRDIMNYVLLRKWSNVSDADVKAISKKLKSGLWWAENLVWFVAGIGVVLILVGIAAINLSKSPGTRILTETIPTDPSITVSERASVSDVDSINFKTGKLIVKFTAGSTNDDRLGIRNQGKDSGKIGISGSNVTYGSTSIGRFEGGKGTEPLIIDFNSNASLEAVQALMRNITYQNLGANPNLGSRTVEFQVTDDGNASSPKTLTRNIFVTRENTAPTLIVPERQAVNENAPLNISGISINDSDSTNNFTVTLTVSNGTITIKDSVSKGLTADNISDNNTKTVKLVGSPGKIKATLTDPTAVIYKGTSDDTLSITVNDGGQDTPKDANKTLIWPPKAQEAKTNSKEIKIAVNPANKPPIITISEPTKIVNEDENLTLNGIKIDDSDTPNLTVKLGVEHGIITVKTNATKGLTANEISGNKTGTVTLTGDIVKIKATLADLQAITYRGKQDFNGNDTLTVNIDDRGRGKTDKLSITVNPVNDPPILGISATVDTPQEVKPQAEDSLVNNQPTPEQSQQPASNNRSPNATIKGEPGSKNIRSGPGTDYDVRHTAYPGDRIRVIGQSNDRGGYSWYKIYFPQSGAEGWIGSQLVQVDDGVQP